MLGDTANPPHANSTPSYCNPFKCMEAFCVIGGPPAQIFVVPSDHNERCVSIKLASQHNFTIQFTDKPFRGLFK